MQPFLPAEFLRFFPPRAYAILLPAAALAGAVAVAGGFIGLVLLRSGKAASPAAPAVATSKTPKKGSKRA